MRNIHGLLLVLLVAVMTGCRQTDESTAGQAGWELKPPAADAVPVSATKQLPGMYPVGSRIVDREAPGGFGPCDNFPKDLNSKDWGLKGAVSLVVFPDEPVAYFKHRGLALRLVNRTAEVVSFSACDSCLFILPEAVASDRSWRAIESPPQAICGNSYHRVYLKPEQYWEFPARLYTGPIKTKIRYRLDPKAGEPPIFSDEFDGHVADAQFQERGGRE
jgi:hypothetical protein